MRRGTRIGLISTAVVITVVLVALFMKMYNETAPPSGAAAQSPSATPAPTDGGKNPTASRSGGIGRVDAGTVSSFPSSLVNKLGHPNKSGPPHEVTLIVTTSGDIARVGYLVPTSDSAPYGNFGAPASPWTRTMTAHGSGYLAAVFVQAGRSGLPVTCRIMIDGATKTVRTTDGAYARQMCIA